MKDVSSDTRLQGVASDRLTARPTSLDLSPLAGVRVLDFTRILSGPYCTLLLADMGAEVIKVESQHGDDTRGWGPPFLDDERTLSAYFGALNRGKKSVVLDLRSSRARDVLRRLCAEVDIVVENFRPGAAERLGLSWPELRGANPALVFCSISGFGQSGAYADLPATEIIVEGMSGLMQITGPEDGEPVRFGIAMTDIATGLTASTRILAALMNARETGVGSHVQCSLYGTALSVLGTSVAAFSASGVEPRRWGSHHPSIVPYGSFPTADGWLITGVVSDTAWPGFCDAFGLESLAHDERFRSNAERVANRGELTETLSRRSLEMPTAHWVERLSSLGLLAAPIRTVGEAVNDPVTQEMGLFVGLDGFPDVLATRTDGTPALVTSEPVPRLGEHTWQVLTELTRLEPEEMNGIVDRSLIRSATGS
jgi:crotonobetainyl-CoA:carnitine CoA-transferase CaiB-like acyl-CoA transferase